ncbi:MAG: LysR family transcriptional regulator [Chthoniobacterales bacterium]
MIELRHLKTLIALSETGNLSKAARRLHLSQPAVSHQVRLLEEGYGVALFERKSNPVRLSVAGQRMLRLAYEAVGLVEEAERDVARISEGNAGQLRIAVECHSCFDWLMPSMDIFRERWEEVEMDLVSGFHADPIGLLHENRADVVIVSSVRSRKDTAFHPLFRYEVLGLLAKHHSLAVKPFLRAKDFASETLVTYPIPDDRLDLIREVLKPAGIKPKQRTTELTVAILQLVASHRGLAALPNWTVQPYLERGYVVSRPITAKGLWSGLYAATTTSVGELAYMQDFLEITRQVCFANHKNIKPFPENRVAAK